MFSPFGKKKLPLVKLQDVVWVSQAARFTVLVSHAQKSIIKILKLSLFL